MKILRNIILIMTVLFVATSLAFAGNMRETINKKYVDEKAGNVSPLTTKGDIFTYDTDSARLPVGSDGQVLLADSSEATGLKFGDVSEVDTLDTVTGRGATTANAITVGNTTIGAGAAGVDYALTFDGEDNDGVITWKEDEDQFDMACDLKVNGTINGTTAVQVNGANVLTAEVDGSVSNEINTITADDVGTTSGLAITLAGAGINATTRSGDTITVTGTEVDGSTTNEINTITADDAGTTAGLDITLAGAGINVTTRAGNTVTITGTEADTLDTVTSRGASTSNLLELTNVSVSTNIEVTGTITDANDKLLAISTKSISFTITKPLSLDEADTLPVWVNRTGKTFNITAIYSNSDTDDTAFTLKECTDLHNFSSLTTIEAITIDQNGTDVYYKDITSGIDHTVIEATHLIVFDNDAADDPNYINCTLEGYYN